MRKMIEGQGEFIKSTKGREKLVFAGYTYDFHKRNREDDIFFWRCERRQDCKARVWTQEREMVGINTNSVNTLSEMQELNVRPNESIKY